MAAASTALIIDLETDRSEAQANLQFQDFSQSAAGETGAAPRTAFPGDAMDDDEESEELLNRERKPPSFWEFAYYQSLFDVTTQQVASRTAWSAIPRFGPGETYLDKYIRPNPDLYGPVWVGATLIVTTSVSSNVASYLESAGRTKQFWHTDYTRVSFATTAILLYIFLVPVLLWATLKYRGVESRYSLMETLCLYGYSLSVYVPISILWAVHLTWLRWLLMIAGALLSGTVLVSTIWPSLRDETRKVAVIIIGAVFALHALLALGFVEYFFHHDPAHSNGPSTHPVVSPSSSVVQSTSVSSPSQATTKAAAGNFTHST